MRLGKPAGQHTALETVEKVSMSRELEEVADFWTIPAVPPPTIT